MPEPIVSGVRLRGFLRWFYPGLRVKRWIAFSCASMILVVAGILLAVGVDALRTLYQSLPIHGAGRSTIIALLLAVGMSGFALSLSRLVRSVARGVAPLSQEKTSSLLYRTRVLERGPRVVAIGGGTGLSTVLRGLKRVTTNITAVVTMTDDGGSSGRLRREIDALPPGDVRNCLLALAEDEGRLSEYFQHRFTGLGELSGHSLGNLVLIGLEQATGGFDRAIEAMSHFLNVRGKVLPSTLAKIHLVAEMEDGEQLQGETRIAEDPRRIRRVFLDAPAAPYDAVLDAIGDSDLIVLGPGSLFTSLIPDLLVEGVAAAIEESAAEKLLIANLMTQPGETDQFTLRDHLRVLSEYINLRRFDGLIVNDARPSESMLSGYRVEAAEPVIDDLGEPNDYGLRVVRADLLGSARWGGKETLKHSPEKLARTIVRHATVFGPARRTEGSGISPSRRRAGGGARLAR